MVGIKYSSLLLVVGMDTRINRHNFYLCLYENKKLKRDTIIISRDISDQRILLFNWMRAFLEISVINESFYLID